MTAYDFLYDGIRLSDKGFTICQFDNGGTETVSNGSQIVFNTVPTMFGRKHELISSSYDTYITATFQICKKDCDNPDSYSISLAEERQIMRWLNRSSFHRMVFLEDEWEDIYFEASFNVAAIKMDGVTVGFELTMTTNRPYACIEYTATITTDGNSASVAYSGIDIDTHQYPSDDIVLAVVTDDEGFIYPKEVRVTMADAGDLTIKNATAGRETIIENCTANEQISLKYPVITSNASSHDLPTDFNWDFFCIASEYGLTVNKLEINTPCTVVITFESAVKINV